MEIGLVEFGTRVAFGDLAEAGDPFDEGGVCRGAIGGSHYSGHDTEKLVVPVALAVGGFRVMVFEEPPDAAQSSEVVCLDFGKRAECDGGTIIEFVVGFLGSFGALLDGRFQDGLAIDEEFEIVGPEFAGASDQCAEDEHASFRAQRQYDRVFGPARRAFDLAILHVIKGDCGIGLTIFAQPEADKPADVFGAQKAAQLDGAA